MKRLTPFGIGWLALVISGPVAAEQPHAFVGSAKCKACHQAEYRSWAATKMARTFELLRPGVAKSAKLRSKLDPERDYTVDKACLPCHTTGYGKPGGFVDAKTTPDLAGTGCETCHGAGAAYVHEMMNRKNKKTTFVSAGLVADVSKDQCIECHNPKTPIGTVVGSRHFVKQFVFSKTKGIHERGPRKTAD